MLQRVGWGASAGRAVRARGPRWGGWFLVGDAVDVVDAVDVADGAQDVAEVLGVAHLEGEAAERYAVAGGLDAGRQDVDVLVGQDAGDVGGHPGAGERLHL